MRGPGGGTRHRRAVVLSRGVVHHALRVWLEVATPLLGMEGQLEYGARVLDGHGGRNRARGTGQGQEATVVCNHLVRWGVDVHGLLWIHLPTSLDGSWPEEEKGRERERGEEERQIQIWWLFQLMLTHLVVDRERGR